MKSVLVYLILVGLGCWAATTPGTGLEKAKTEPNLEKRSRLLLENAETALDQAREAYGSGNVQEAGSLLDEVRDSTVLAAEALRETGKDPRKSPKWFKRAEIQTRKLMRKLEVFRNDMSVSDRPLLQDVLAQVTKVHDELLTGVMEGKNR